MKKIIVSIVFVIIAHLLFAQSYKFIAGDQNLYIFSEDSANFQNTYRPHGYQFDEISELDEGSVLKSYNSAEYYYSGIDNEGGYNHNTSWIGDSVLLYDDGSTKIYNQYGKEFFFKPMDDFIPWTIIEENNGARIEGKFTGFESVEIFPDYEENIAILELSVYDSLGNIFENHPIQNFQILISDNYGFIRCFRLNYFFGIYEYGELSIHDKAYHLVGFKSQTDAYGYIFNFNSIITSVETGTEVHYTYENIFKDYEGTIYSKKKFLDKSINDSLVIYQISECIRQINSDLDTSFTIEYEESYYYNQRPQEFIAYEGVENQNFIRIYRNPKYITFDSYLFSIFNLVYSYEYEGKTLWYAKPDFGYSHSTFASYQFVDELGKRKSYRGIEANPDEFVFYTTEFEDWGTPFEFNCTDYSGLEETQLSEISIYPNPAEDVIYIDSPQNIDLVQFIDIQGRLIESFELNENKSFDVSDLKKGIYLIKIKTNNSEVKRKLIIR